jgi:RNA polymerase sigma-70 factor (ECF subfamily)
MGVAARGAATLFKFFWSMHGGEARRGIAGVRNGEYGMGASWESDVTDVSTYEEPAADDVALMREIASGDSRAFKRLYDRHSSAVYTLALRMLKQVQDAEQLLTDVFFEVWNARARYDETRACPRTYLMRLTRSRAIDRLRRKGAIGIDQQVGATLDPAEGIDVAVEERPGESAEMQEERERIVRALATLDAEQRAAIECAYFDGMSHAQIAQRLNKPLGTIKSYIRLGMGKLRAAFGVGSVDGTGGRVEGVA